MSSSGFSNLLNLPPDPSQQSPQQTPTDTPWLRFDFPLSPGSAVSHLDSDPGAKRRVEREVLLFTRPERLIVAHRLEEVVPALRAVQEAVDAGLYASGFVSYEAGWALDASLASTFAPFVSTSTVSSPVASSVSFSVASAFDSFPLVWFGVYPSPERSTGDALDGGDGYRVSDWKAMTSREQYAQDIATIRELIGRGETYQVNYTLRLRAEVTGNDRAFYRDLVDAQRPEYAAYLALGRYRVLSASPELFFYRRGDQIVTRPMKGTIARGRWPEEDRKQAEALANSVKNRAENLMIVDLLRNDLGRLAVPGSVRVDSLFDIERYPNVWQMTSTVAARLPSDPLATPTLTTLLAALFPCGSITGAPKINTMRHIARLETLPRHLYCGAIGYLTPHADPQQRETIFNVAIRTVLLDTHTGIAEYGVGGGITWDSTSDDEYAEILMKAKILNGNHNQQVPASVSLPAPSNMAPDLELLESLRLEKGRYWLLDRHMERLERTASHFGYPVSLSEVRAQLDALALESLREESLLSEASTLEKISEKISEKGDVPVASQQNAPAKSGSGKQEEQHNLGDVARNTAAARQEQPPRIWKVRCLVSAEGRVRLERLELGPDGKFPLAVVLASSPVSRDEPLLYHKTTHRAIYDAHLAEAQAGQYGLFDVLLWNAEGELTEFTQGNLVASVRGRLLTPPVASGLLAGTLRAELLARGDVREQIIRHEDLAHTTGMWLINSVRGWLPVRLLDNPYAHRRL